MMFCGKNRVFLMTLTLAAGMSVSTVCTQLQAQKNESFKITATTIAKILGDESIKSHEGRDFQILRATKKVKNAKGTLKFYLQGALHGDETLGADFVAWFAKRLEGSVTNDITSTEGYSVQIDMLTIANPDGYERRSRTNARGINLNRNFSVLWGMTREFPGVSPASEKETVAIQKLMAKESYLAAVDVHGYTNWVVAPSDLRYSDKSSKYSQRQKLMYEDWFQSLNRLVAGVQNYELKTASALGDGGAFEDWAYWANGTFAFCLELSHRERVTKEEDLFPKYEKKIASMFDEAIRIYQKKNLWAWQ